MSTTPDLAPTRSRRNGSRREQQTTEQLEAQIKSLQEDIKNIGSLLGKLSNEKVGSARAAATKEYHQVVEAGQHMIDEVSDQATVLEKQLKSTIREKPLTAVAAAVGIGFVLALLTR